MVQSLFNKDNDMCMIEHGAYYQGSNVAGCVHSSDTGILANRFLHSWHYS